MEPTPPHRSLITRPEILPPAAGSTTAPALTSSGAAALAAAQALAKKAAAPATLRAYKADWTHFAQWCAAHGFVPVPAAPATVGVSFSSKLSADAREATVDAGIVECAVAPSISLEGGSHHRRNVGRLAYVGPNRDSFAASFGDQRGVSSTPLVE